MGQQMHLALETQPPLSIVLHSHARSPTGPGGHFLEGSREADSPLSPLRSAPASPSPRTKQRPHLGLRPPLDWLGPGAGGPGHMGVLQLTGPTQGLGPQSPHLSIPPHTPHTRVESPWVSPAVTEGTSEAWVTPHSRPHCHAPGLGAGLEGGAEPLLRVDYGVTNVLSKVA